MLRLQVPGELGYGNCFPGPWGDLGRDTLFLRRWEET